MTPDQPRVKRAYRRSAPDDFASIADTMKNVQLGKHYGVSTHTIARWRRETGIRGLPGNHRINRVYTSAPVPDDFREMARTMNSLGLQKHYGRSDTVVRRWLKETSVAPAKVKHERPPPADLAERARELCKTELYRHYRVCPRVLRRWLAETGIVPKEFDRSANPQPRRSKFRTWNFAGPKPAAVPGRDFSMHGQAADHLRPFAAVYRCTEKGAADHKGEFWRYGNVVLTPDELLQRAEAKGWSAMRWAA